MYYSKDYKIANSSVRQLVCVVNILCQ